MPDSNEIGPQTNSQVADKAIHSQPGHHASLNTASMSTIAVGGVVVMLLLGAAIAVIIRKTRRPQDKMTRLLTLAGIIAMSVALWAAVEDKSMAAAIGLLFAVLAFVLVERNDTRHCLDQINDLSRELKFRLDDVATFFKVSNPDQLTIAVFDELLINLPLYVADSEGYLDQENIRILKYDRRGSDLDVARTVADSGSCIGLCDPCMCALEEFARSANQVLVVTPLVNRSAARALTKRESLIRSTLLKGGELSIATYPAPSTTFVMAAALAQQLYKKNRASGSGPLRIALNSISATEFTRDNLDFLLSKHDIVMLWEPFVTLACLSPETSVFVLNPPISSDENMMYSAIIASQRLLLDRPTLALRTFRALSRATHRLHLAASDAHVMATVVGALKRHTDFGLEDATLRRLIANMATTGIGPIVDRPEDLEAYPVWRGEIYRAIQHRIQASQVWPKELNDRLVPVSSQEDCRRFIVPADAFRHRAPSPRSE